MYEIKQKPKVNWLRRNNKFITFFSLMTVRYLFKAISNFGFVFKKRGK